MKNNNVVFLADNMEVMKKFPDKYFDLCVADPPYFSGPERRKYYGKAKSTTGVLRHEYPVTDKWTVPGAEYFREIQRISKKYIIFGCNYFDFIFDPGRIVWDKCNGSSTLSDCEIAATNCHDSVRLFRYMWNGMMQGKSMTEGATMRGNKKLNDVRIHPTQKPIDLYRWIFAKYTEPGYKVFDPNVGSGTSAGQPGKWGWNSSAVRSRKNTGSSRRRPTRNILHRKGWREYEQGTVCLPEVPGIL